LEQNRFDANKQAHLPPSARTTSTTGTLAEEALAIPFGSWISDF
jgi:hypothetical protein